MSLGSCIGLMTYWAQWWSFKSTLGNEMHSRAAADMLVLFVATVVGLQATAIFVDCRYRRGSRRSLLHPDLPTYETELCILQAPRLCLLMVRVFFYGPCVFLGMKSLR